MEQRFLIVFLVLVFVLGVFFGLTKIKPVDAQAGQGGVDLCGECQVKTGDCMTGNCGCDAGKCQKQGNYWPCYCSDPDGDGTGICKMKSGVTVCSRLGTGQGKTIIGKLIDRIISWILKVAFVVVPIMFVIAGLLFYTAGGDSSKVKLAKQIALWTLIGFMVILFSNAVGSIINYILGR